MLFGSSGIRKIYDSELLFLALKTGMAVSCNNPETGTLLQGLKSPDSSELSKSADTCGADLSKITIMTGRDCRTSGKVLQDAFSAGALHYGAKVIDGGIAPTPTVAYAGRKTSLSCCRYPIKTRQSLRLDLRHTSLLSLQIYLHYSLRKAPRLTQIHLAKLCLLSIGYQYIIQFRIAFFGKLY